jgi:phosphoribosylanthranilate isomerase
MHTRIKICCIRSEEEANLAIAAGVDALGFVGVFPPTSRTIPDARIAQIAKRVPPPIETFVLTSETRAAAISAHIRETGTTGVQILYPIDPSESERLALLDRTTRRLQVIHIEGPEALELIPAYAPHVDAFVLDSGRPTGPAPVFGGTGRTHDWEVSAAFVKASPRPVFLAGGLSPDNIRAAMVQVEPFGVDLCSGVRTEGELDAEKLAAFVSAVRTGS